MTDISDPKLPGPGDIENRLTDGSGLRSRLKVSAERERKRLIDRLVKLAQRQADQRPTR